MNVLKLKGKSTKVGSCSKMSRGGAFDTLKDPPRGAITSAVAIVRE